MILKTLILSLGYLCFNNLQFKATSLQTLIKIIPFSSAKKEFTSVVLNQTDNATLSATEGWTFTYKALNVAKNQLFLLANGARPGVSKVCVA